MENKLFEVIKVVTKNFKESEVGDDAFPFNYEEE